MTESVSKIATAKAAIAGMSMAAVQCCNTATTNTTEPPKFWPNGRVHAKNRKKRKIAKRSKRANRKHI